MIPKLQESKTVDWNMTRVIMLMLRVTIVHTENIRACLLHCFKGAHLRLDSATRDQLKLENLQRTLRRNGMNTVMAGRRRLYFLYETIIAIHIMNMVKRAKAPHLYLEQK